MSFKCKLKKEKREATKEIKLNAFYEEQKMENEKKDKFIEDSCEKLGMTLEELDSK